MVQALGDDERVTLLTLDESDVAPGRLRLYLEAVLGVGRAIGDRGRHRRWETASVT